jgi:hypothetical protein
MAEKDVVSINSKEAQDFLRQRQQGGLQFPLVQPSTEIDGMASSPNVAPINSPQAQSVLRQSAPAQRDYSLGEIVPAAVTNFPSSAANFYGGIVDAVTSPIDTIKSVFQLGGGAALAALPKNAQDFLMSVGNDPAKMQESINMAKAAGGFYADRYGSASGFKRAIAEDPVGVAADFSTLLSGGATATARVAPTASKVSQALADFSNPMAPFALAAETRVPGTGRTVGENIATGGGLLYDVATGRAGERTARNILTQSIGESNLPAVAQLSDPRFANMSAAEAVLAAGVNRPQFQTLARDVAATDPNNVFFQREMAAPQARQQALASVTPNLSQAIEARSAAANPLYEAARDFNLPVNTESIVKSIDETLKANPGNTKLRSALLDVKKGVRKSKNAGELSSVNDNIKSLLDSRDNRFIQGNLINIREQINALIPGMAEAKQTFADMSRPVNQATVLNEMQRRLTGPMDQERPGQFMRVLGEGEEALLKRSTGAPRFQEGDLMKILSEEQGRVVTDISDQLRRERTMDVQARRGAQGLEQIMDQNRPLGFRVPNVLNRTVMVTNRTLNILEGKISDSTRASLEKAMLSGDNLNKFINDLPNKDRSAVLNAVRQAGEMVTIDQARNVGLLQQVIDSTEE